MVESRQRDNWTHTSAILALTANCNRDPKRRPLKPDDFNPFARENRIKKTVELAEIKAMFLRNKK